DLADFPLAAAVEHRQLTLVPLPLAGQALQQTTLPALAAVAWRTADLLVGLQIEAAANQFESLEFAAGCQVLLQSAIDHDVGVQLVEVEAVGVDRLLVAQRQTLHGRVFAGVDLGQQQLEYRLVGRLDALVQLPHACADELARWNPRQMAEVEHLFGTQEALRKQGVHVLAVATFLVDRHQPPERRASAEPDGGAVELVEQQVVLGGAAVVGGQVRLTVALGETRGVDQK